VIYCDPWATLRTTVICHARSDLITTSTAIHYNAETLAVSCG